MSYYVNTPEYDLNTARTGFKERLQGHRIEILETNDASATITVYVRGNDHRDSGPFQLQKGDYVEFPEKFSEVLFTNTTQSGVDVTLGVTLMDVPPAKFEYFRASSISVDSIGEPVMTQGGSDCSTVGVALSTTADTALAANAARTGWLIQNPSTSGAVMYWKYGSAGSDFHELLPGASAGGTGRGLVEMKSASGTPTVIVTEEANS